MIKLRLSLFMLVALFAWTSAVPLHGQSADEVDIEVNTEELEAMAEEIGAHAEEIGAAIEKWVQDNEENIQAWAEWMPPSEYSTIRSFRNSG